MRQILVAGWSNAFALRLIHFREEVAIREAVDRDIDRSTASIKYKAPQANRAGDEPWKKRKR